MARKINRRKQIGAALHRKPLDGTGSNDAIVTSEIDKEIANYSYTDSQNVANAFDNGLLLAQSESDAIDAFWMMAEQEDADELNKLKVNKVYLLGEIVYNR